MFKKVLKFLFFILLSINFQEVFASDQTYTLIRGYAGSSNRIRKYNQFVYTYDTQKGFFCRPESVKGSLYSSSEGVTPKSSPKKFYTTYNTNQDGFFDKVSDFLTGIIANPGKLGANIGADVIDTLLSPLGCTAIISTYAKTGIGVGTAITLVLQMLNSLFGTYIYDYIGGSDYGIDIMNPNCSAITTIMLTSCVGYLITNKMFGPMHKATLITYLTLISAYFLVKLIQGNIQEVRAIENYNKLNLCGDDWYTFGNQQLFDLNNNSGVVIIKDGDKAKFPELKDTQEILTSGINKNDLTATVLGYYPTKTTSLPGSYKFMLDKCIEEIKSANNSSENASSAGYCSLINVSKTDYVRNGQVILNINNKIFREQLYGGVEIMFETNNSDNNYFDNCYDPRPEAANYDIYAFISEKNQRKQAYYARGMDGLNFACERWQGKEAYRDAFECCVQASKTFMCINYHSPNSNDGVENLFFNQKAFQTRYKNYLKKVNGEDQENINMFCDINKTKCKIDNKTADKNNNSKNSIDLSENNCKLSNYKTENNQSTLKNIFIDNNYKIEGDTSGIIKMLVTGSGNKTTITKFTEINSINDLVSFYINKCDGEEKISNICDKQTITDIQIESIKQARDVECSTFSDNEVCKCISKLSSETNISELKDKYNTYSKSNKNDEIACSSFIGEVCAIKMDTNNKIYTEGTGNSSVGILGIELKISPSELDGDTKYCVKTQSYCPYDFNIAGGTEKIGNQFRSTLNLNKNKAIMDQYECSRKNENGSCETSTFGLCQIRDNISGEIVEYRECNNKDSNFCQLQRHCQFINEYVILNENMPNNPYLDKACINFVGSSKLSENYSQYYSYKPLKNPKYGHFTAPIIECIVETAKNQLYNKAGRTICNNPSEVPNDDPYISEKEICATGVKYRKGDTILGENSNIFHNLRKKLKSFYLILLTLSIVFYGLKVVVLNHQTSFPELTKHLFKIVFIITFCYNSKWVNVVLNSVFELTDTVILYTIDLMQIDSLSPSYNNNSFDGCYFASDPFYTDDKNAVQSNLMPQSQWTKYENGRGYLALLDMIDCKIRLYLGMTLNNSALSILLICILIVFTGSIIIILILPLILIFMSIFLLTMKVAYMLMVTMLSMVILLFATPIILPLILFDKTKNIFDKWLSSIVGFMLYTMFFVIAITIVFSFISSTFLNGARFTGTQNAPFRDLYCGYTCKLTLGTKTIDNMISETEIENCKNQGGTVTNLKTESLFCFLNTPHMELNKDGGFLDFIVKKLNIKMLDVRTIKSSWSLLFSQGLIVLLIFIMADEILNAILKLASNIFGVNMSSDLVPSIASAMGKISNYIGDKVFNNPLMSLLKAGGYKTGEALARDGKKIKKEETAQRTEINAEIKDDTAE